MGRAGLVAARWGALAMIVAGGSLTIHPLVDRLAGEWRQLELAAANDTAIPRYRHALAAAYDSLIDDFEGALVSYEVGARPTGFDGRELDRAPTVTAQTTGRSAGTSTPASTPAVTAPATPPTEPIPDSESGSESDAASPEPGFPESIIRIPKIGLSQAVVDGVSRDHLKNGPGHYPGTALPGTRGNVVISGHRTTYTAPFSDLDLLRAGDEILIDTSSGSYRYLTESSHVVSPDDVGLLAATDRPVLTLTTCTPKGSARSRLVIVAVLDG